MAGPTKPLPPPFVAPATPAGVTPGQGTPAANPMSPLDEAWAVRPEEMEAVLNDLFNRPELHLNNPPRRPDATGAARKGVLGTPAFKLTNNPPWDKGVDATSDHEGLFQRCSKIDPAAHEVPDSVRFIFNVVADARVKAALEGYFPRGPEIDPAALALPASASNIFRPLPKDFYASLANLPDLSPEQARTILQNSPLPPAEYLAALDKVLADIPADAKAARAKIQSYRDVFAALIEPER